MDLQVFFLCVCFSKHFDTTSNQTLHQSFFSLMILAPKDTTSSNLTLFQTDSDLHLQFVM